MKGNKDMPQLTVIYDLDWISQLEKHSYEEHEL